jgi:cell division protein FtsZ
MTLKLSVPQSAALLKPRIAVIGVGGAGGNAVNNMISSHLEGVEFVVANTDSQALAQSLSERKIQLGQNITHGLGAGARPEIGRAAAEEAIDEIVEHLQGAHMAFITAGMGGGTGTGAAPVIARLGREHGILTVGVVTKPFQFEGIHRMRIAEAGIEEMQQYVDTLIIIPNQNLFRIANEKTTFAQAFAMADEVLHCGVRGVTDLMVVPGLINLDFADIRTVMSEMGKAMMGTGEAEGEDRAKRAAEAAISNPLLDDVSMKGARGVLINITGGSDLTLFEVDEAANRIGDEVDSEANIIFGSTVDPALDGKVRVSVVATGIDAATQQQRPVLKVYSQTPPRPRQAEPAAPGGEERLAAVTPLRSVPPAAAAPPVQPAAPAGHEPPATQAAAREAPLAAARAAPPAPAASAALAPPPVAAGPKAAAAAPQPDPFRAADLLNGAGQAKAARPSLFARVTSGGLLRKETAEPEPRREPFAAKPPPAKPAAPEQPRLEGVDRAERRAAPPAEEDLLDIPAFLRRQAN